MTALTAGVRGLKVTITKFNNFKPSPKPNDVTPSDAKPKPTGNIVLKPGPPKDDGKLIHWKQTLPATEAEKTPKKDKSGKTHWWCEKCNLWNLLHTTDRLKAKASRTTITGANLCQGVVFF